MDYPDETLCELIQEYAAIDFGVENTGQEVQLQEAKTLRVDDKHNLPVISANQLSPVRVPRNRVPGVRVKGLKRHYIIIPGRKGMKGEKVVVLGAEQEWTLQGLPITVHSDSDSESATAKEGQTVENYKPEIVDGRTSISSPDSADECELRQGMRSNKYQFEQKNTKGCEKPDVMFGQTNACRSTTYREVAGDKSLNDDREFNVAYAEGKVAVSQLKQNMVDSQGCKVASTDFAKEHKIHTPKSTATTDDVGITDSGKKSFFPEEDKQSRCKASTIVIQIDSDSEHGSVLGKRRRTNTVEDFNERTLPSKRKRCQHMIEPGSDIGELDLNQCHKGETDYLDFLSLDPRTKVCRLLQIFHERRRFYNEEENRRLRFDARGTEGQRNRSDLKAYAYIEKQVMPPKQSNGILGDIPGVEVGDYFFYRIELLLVGIHRQIQAGIDYIATTGRKPKFFDTTGAPVSVAVSVVSSRGGLYHDTFKGETLIYTGQGNKNADQQLVRGNLALKNTCDLGLSVRLVRGVEVPKGEFSSERCSRICSPSGFVYIYDGLYIVEKYYQDKDRNGFKEWKFKLVRQPDQKRPPEFLKDLVYSQI